MNCFTQVGVALMVFGAPRAEACTLCDSALARAVRAEVLGPDFWSNFGFAVLPFVIVLTITGAIHYGLFANALDTAARKR